MEMDSEVLEIWRENLEKCSQEELNYLNHAMDLLWEEIKKNRCQGKNCPSTKECE